MGAIVYDRFLWSAQVSDRKVGLKLFTKALEMDDENTDALINRANLERLKVVYPVMTYNYATRMPRPVVESGPMPPLRSPGIPD